MLDRWRLAIGFALFGFVASAAIIAHSVMGNYTELEVRWGRMLDVVCPAHLLVSVLFPNVNEGTPLMALLWLAQTAANAAIYFAAGALLTRMLGSGR